MVQVRGLAGELGLSPSALARLSALGSDQESDTFDFGIKGRG
jgi:hypothetical protein